MAHFHTSATLLPYPDTVEGARWSPEAYFIRVLISIMEILLSLPNHFSEAPPPNIVMWINVRAKRQREAQQPVDKAEEPRSSKAQETVGTQKGGG